ncbi:MAG: hypothetical protein HC898_07550 [Phycisphaerales bacterium]|nr:hypothetical protein [Phycisphaerales bacterium]
MTTGGVVPADETLAYEVPKANLPLADSPLAFRDRVVKNWQSAELVRLIINQPDKPQVMLSRTVSRVDEQAKPGSWTLQGHEKFEPFAVDELIKQLTPIKAQDWLTQAPAWSADSKLKELQITLSDDTQHTLKVNPTDRSALLGGMDAAFVITPELLTALQAEFAKSSSSITPAPALPMP